MDTSPSPTSEPTLDQPARLPMPGAVRVAIALIVLPLLVEISMLPKTWAALQAPGMPKIALYTVLGGAAGGYALNAVLIVGLVWRKNWARIGWLVLTLLGLASLLMPHLANSPASDVMLSNVTQVANIVATYLLFSAGGRAWFRRDEPEHA
jgi:hypothetical protein